ncbi:Uncharacterised protein [Streptococcus pneumoniae]|nr:Uncharacterised protein [Streptococcus pneumoniae]
MKALAHENGLAYDSTYFHYCNTICPSCHEEMKVINGIVQNVGSIGVGVMEKLGFVVPYAVCVQCNEQSETQTELEKEENSDRGTASISEKNHAKRTYLKKEPKFTPLRVNRLFHI